MSHSRVFIVGAVLCVSVVLFASGLQAQVLPAPWTDADIGAPDIAGSASESGGTFSVRGAGADIWDGNDQFHFVYQPVAGNVDVRACVAAVDSVEAWTKAGVMIRETVSADSRHASSFVTPAKGLAFQRRIAPGAISTHTSGEPSTAPYCVRIVRAGELFTSYASGDGASWTLIGSDTIPMGASAYVGLAVTSHDATRAATAAFERVSVTTLPSTPASDWTHNDIGNPALAGRASESSGTFSVTGAGDDIWNGADQFHFMHQSVTGDVEIVARVEDIGYASVWSKAGVMIREDLTASAAHAFMTGSSARGWAFQRRPVSGGTSAHSPGTYAAPPGWVKLVRSGNAFSAYESVDGTIWTLVGTETIDMPAAVYVGLAVTSHNASATSTATFTNVAITTTGATGEPQPPTVTLTAPASGTTYTAPATVLLSATASDAGTIARVEFFANGQSIGTDEQSPYEATWSSVAEGTYDLTAVATDDSGASTTSSAATVTVNAPANSPPTSSITSPANGATFVAPANITINATAADADGTIARVDFFANGQSVGTDTASPFSISWSSVPSGTYSLTAVATDDDGATMTSAAMTVTVSAAPPPPTPTSVAFTASEDHETLVTSYTVAIYRAGDPVTATPVASKDLGKPAPSSGEITVDISDIVDPLASGSYFAVVSAVGAGGSSPSAPSATFDR